MDLSPETIFPIDTSQDLPEQKTAEQDCQIANVSIAPLLDEGDHCRFGLVFPFRHEGGFSEFQTYTS